MQTLGWPDVDRTAGRIVLRREHSKNGEPRVLPLLGDLAALIERRWTAREYQTAEGRRRCRRSSSIATASRSATSGKRGSPPARTPGSPAPSSTTSGAPPCGTWTGPA